MAVLLPLLLFLRRLPYPHRVLHLHQPLSFLVTVNHVGAVVRARPSPCDHAAVPQRVAAAAAARPSGGTVAEVARPSVTVAEVDRPSVIGAAVARLCVSVAVHRFVTGAAAARPCIRQSQRAGGSLVPVPRAPHRLLILPVAGTIPLHPPKLVLYHTEPHIKSITTKI